MCPIFNFSELTALILSPVYSDLVLLSIKVHLICYSMGKYDIKRSYIYSHHAMNKLFSQERSKNLRLP